MKRQSVWLGVVFGVWFGLNSAALAVPVEDKEAKEAPPAEEPGKALLISLEGDEPPESVSPVLTVGGRVDVGFSAGSPVTQGFSIASLRLNAMGSVGRFVDYGLAFGQTRE